tara:strand:+ start:410 stop:586 length:177 start_codon:yes stop_codon:yes gene_type:complete
MAFNPSSRVFGLPAAAATRFARSFAAASKGGAPAGIISASRGFAFSHFGVPDVGMQGS